MSHIAIIPARSGSKGLKDKNIKELCGKPLLAYTIEAALKSRVFDCVHVSTDSDVYASIAKKYGAEVPFLRTSQNSTDKASSWDVVKEVLDKYSEKGIKFDKITLLQPTSPLRNEEDIRKAERLYTCHNAKAIVSVCEMDHSPLWANVLDENGSMNGFIKRQQGERRQELDKFYRINGAIYTVDTDFLFEDDFIYREGCYAYVMDRTCSIDIDSQFDFDEAEMLIKNIEYTHNNMTRED